MQIDRETGNRRVISDRDHGAGPYMFSPTAFAVDGDLAYVADDIRDAVLEVDLLTGDRSLVAAMQPGSAIFQGTGIAVDGDQAILVSHDLRIVTTVDLQTGEQVTLSK